MFEKHLAYDTCVFGWGGVVTVGVRHVKVRTETRSGTCARLIPGRPESVKPCQSQPPPMI